MAEYRFTAPTRESLSPQQKLALDSPSMNILNGVPGTGKTTVSLFRFINKYKDDVFEKPLLLTYGKLLMASIRGYILHLGRNEAMLNNANTFKSWFGTLLKPDTKFKECEAKGFDFTLDQVIIDLGKSNISEVIIDEAQDIKELYHKVVANLFPNKVNLGADDNQMIISGGVPVDCLKKTYQIPVKELTHNYRNTYQIFQFAMQFLPDNERVRNNGILERLKRDKYDESSTPRVFTLINDNWEYRNKLILDLIKENKDLNYGILTYNAWSVNIVSTFLKNNGIENTKYHSEVDSQDIISLKNVIVTTTKSCKGLEFDRVIIPSFTKFDDTKDGNDYYVVATRAKSRLYLICGQKLPDILDKKEFKSKYKHEAI